MDETENLVRTALGALCKECDLGKKVRTLEKKRRFWHQIWGNKWFFWLVCAGIVSAFSWGGWVTNEIFAQKQNTATGKLQDKQICDDVKDIKQAIKDNREQRDVDQRETMRILLEIQKEVNRKR